MLSLSNRIIVGNHNGKVVAKCFGLFHVMQMTGMKQVKHTHRHHALHSLTYSCHPALAQGSTGQIKCLEHR
jgi:hypothetical protein